ncbi:sulfur carrier protein ThiS [Pseudoalteromonas shioyasakiensis]|jgi:sulfur carrier protein|uniref:sulfur carrier protein ThiS n=1 Tax=Pseudoalteromonas TaxID=53246 RepID=UPI000C97B14E|nr:MULTISPECIES: sulfur carrier protein ThiS [Pseudoalteromonas]MAD03912.1 thiamine biosynthesis protein ThiS [Pseudoalteromonas sp.]MCQ8883067.1 sulfur carrier protein ThiS [Pseudoalteromonas shioyasakiensis]NIZ07270.1 sulfur carrier protein ThiS [Pseudoalteromonas sp. HF66]QLE08221.1 sulfur carrier protein ThiS [Pseudoalteromonas shioyasakiensis]RZD20956.1 sulfur carrier protein ThiS [Pseudoalteromonas sp. MEBiC 03485]|tara:strand:- start:6003 stop:6200 length:198 start_codon:yes stop_codon:yes gene_type:complete
MNILINGQSVTVSDDTSLTQALNQFGARPPFAVAVNGDFVPRSQCDAKILNEGDSIELLSPIQGG